MSYHYTNLATRILPVITVGEGDDELKLYVLKCHFGHVYCNVYPHGQYSQNAWSHGCPVCNHNWLSSELAKRCEAENELALVSQQNRKLKHTLCMIIQYMRERGIADPEGRWLDADKLGEEAVESLLAIMQEMVQEL